MKQLAMNTGGQVSKGN